MEEQSFSTILEKVSLFELEEMAPASIDPNDSKYIYGKMYDYHPLLLMEKIIGVLSSLQIEFESKSRTMLMQMPNISSNAYTITAELMAASPRKTATTPRRSRRSSPSLSSSSTCRSTRSRKTRRRIWWTSSSRRATPSCSFPWPSSSTTLLKRLSDHFILQYHITDNLC